MFAMTRSLKIAWPDLARAAYSRSARDLGTQRAFDDLREQDILAAVDAAVIEYVNDPGLCSDDEHGFPSRALLTGRYHVDRVADNGVHEGRRRILVSCACSGRDVTGEEVPYLGLDVRLSAPLGAASLRVDRVDSFVL